MIASFFLYVKLHFTFANMHYAIAKGACKHDFDGGGGVSSF